MIATEVEIEEEETEEREEGSRLIGGGVKAGLLTEVDDVE